MNTLRLIQYADLPLWTGQPTPNQDPDPDLYTGDPDPLCTWCKLGAAHTKTQHRDSLDSKRQLRLPLE